MYFLISLSHCGGTFLRRKRWMCHAPGRCKAEQRPLFTQNRWVLNISKPATVLCQSKGATLSQGPIHSGNKKVNFFSTSACQNVNHGDQQPPAASADTGQPSNKRDVRESRASYRTSQSMQNSNNVGTENSHTPVLPGQTSPACYLVWNKRIVYLGPFSIFMVKLLTALCVVSAIHDYVFDFCPAVGPSMQPLIEASGDLLVFERKHFQILRTFVSTALKKEPTRSSVCGPYRRGDVVIAHSMDDKPMKVCKRIMALPEEWIILPPVPHDINARRAAPGMWQPDDDFASFPRPFQIPPGHVWLQGDNLAVSRDSRFYGPVPETNILGRVFCRIWPIWRFRWITSDITSSEQRVEYDESSRDPGAVAAITPVGPFPKPTGSASTSAGFIAH